MGNKVYITLVHFSGNTFSDMCVLMSIRASTVIWTVKEAVFGIALPIVA